MMPRSIAGIHMLSLSCEKGAVPWGVPVKGLNNGLSTCCDIVVIEIVRMVKTEKINFFISDFIYILQRYENKVEQTKIGIT